MAMLTLGKLKIDSGAATLRSLNPGVEVAGVAVRLDASNARELLAGQHVVIDGSDNFATRYAVNEACVALGIPNVHGSVFRFEGQVSVFWPARPGDAGPCYRCLYPEPPPPELAPSCAEAGVLGVVPGIIGLLQASGGTEAAARRRRATGRADAALRRTARPLR